MYGDGVVIDKINAFNSLSMCIKTLKTLSKTTIMFFNVKPFIDSK